MNERRSRWQGRRIGVLALMVLAALALRVANANPAQSQSTTLQAWRVDRDPTLSPSADVWSDILPISVPLTAQQGVYPLGGGSVATVQVKAIHHEDRLYLRVEWADRSHDVSTNHVTSFADAVAVEFPSVAASTVPAVCMGQADGGVNIWQWRADRQANLSASSSGDRPVVDYYPSRDDLWFPAREAGNPYASVAGNPVQTLAAQSFGTIGPTPEQPVVGQASYEGGHWSVVFSRAFASPGADQPAFAVNEETDIAFAVWDGNNGDRDGQKQVSQFVRMSFSKQAPTPGWGWVPIVLAFALFIPVLVLMARGGSRNT
ncbi:MAG: ethylbenzene dehydrogenase-related protein [Actinomycetota bacterium]